MKELAYLVYLRALYLAFCLCEISVMQKDFVSIMMITCSHN